MNEELNALAEILHSCGWTSPSDAQWTRLEAAIPDIRELLSVATPPAAVAKSYAKWCQSADFRLDPSELLWMAFKGGRDSADAVAVPDGWEAALATPPASQESAREAVAFLITDSDGVRIVRLAEHVDPLRLVAVDVAPLVLASDYAMLAAAPSAPAAPVAGVDVETAFAEWSEKRGVWPRLTHDEIFSAGWSAALLASAPAVPVAQKPWRTMAQHAASGGMPIFVNEETAGKLRDLDGWDVFEVYRDEPAVPVGDGWMPIETAPKDGTFFIATGFNYGKSSEPRHYCMALWEQGEWREASEWNGHSSLAYLTHWRPLPPAPSVDGEG